MTLKPTSWPARLIVLTAIAVLFVALVATTLSPAVAAFVRHQTLVGRIAEHRQQIEAFRADPIVAYDLTSYMIDAPETTAQEVQATLQHALQGSGLEISRLERVVGDEAEMDAGPWGHGFIWYEAAARGDLLSLSRFVDQLRLTQPDLLLRRVDIRALPAERPGSNLDIELEIGRLWLASPELADVGGQNEPGASATTLPSVDGLSALNWLQASPFAIDHGAYARPAPPQPPPPPPPYVEVKLLGITRRGDALTAALLIDNREIAAQLGETTAAGEIIEIGSSVVVFAGEPPRRVGLFD